MKKVTDKLILNKETLRDLNERELDAAAGAGSLTVRTHPCCNPTISTPSCVCYTGGPGC